MAHVQPNKRKAWEAHAQQGFYLGPALEHYQCHRIYITKTLSGRVIDQLVWLPHNNIKLEEPTAEETLSASIQDLSSAIKHINKKKHQQFRTNKAYAKKIWSLWNEGTM